MIKLVHTADLHFGLAFNRYPTVAERLKEERLKALQALVQHGSNEGAHGFVVAGDLFDSRTVSQNLVKEVKSALAAFNGDVFIIPGNHDWYNESANENKVWKWFEDAPGSNVHFLKQWIPYTFTLNHQEVTFYPCGCHQKHSDENLLGWVQDAEKNSAHVNIGIAHGNVEGFGLDDEGRYFNMTSQELTEAGLDCWLLGHIHAPHPGSNTAEHEPFFFAGNHCPDSWKTERSGGAWLIEIDDKSIRATRWNHQGICFRNRAFTVHHPDDVERLVRELQEMDTSQTVLRLSVDGALTEDEREESRVKVEEVLAHFLYNEPGWWQVELKITAAAINKEYPEGTVPHLLLTSLSKAEEDSLAMQLAYRTIKNLS